MALLAGMTFRVDAALAQCGGAPTPSIEVRAVAPEATYRLAESGAGLAVGAAQAGTALGRGNRLLGFTLNRYELEIAVSTEPDGRGCFRLGSATVEIAARSEVLIDGRFAAGSCQHDAIVAHENEHVAVFRAAVADYVPAIDAVLREALPASLAAATAAGASAAYAQQARATVAPWLDAIRRRAQDGNDRLDTAASYVAVFRRCPSW